MKNSEMKTIIRHIDRLTRNLNVKGRRRDAGHKVEDAIHEAADKIDKIVNDLFKTLAYSDISDYGKADLAIQSCKKSFPERAYNRLNSIVDRRKIELKRLSSIVERQLAKTRER